MTRRNDRTANARQLRKIDREKAQGIARVLLKVPKAQVENFKALAALAVQAQAEKALEKSET